MRDDFKVPEKRPKPKTPPKAKVHKPAPVVDDEPIETITLDEGEPIESEETQPPKPSSEPKSEKGYWARITAWWKSLNRNVRFGVITAACLIFCGVVLAIYLFTLPESDPSFEVINHAKAAPKITTVASPLTGAQVSPAQAARPVTGIMIENSLWARPQSGLQDAGVVYEAVAEAGITRFLALFQESTPQYIGPVRSLRPYFIDYAAPYQASIVHVGGSPDALHEVENGSFRNLDQFFNGGYFWRIGSRDAPHNMYTSFAKLDALEKSKGYTKSSFTGWPRKADNKLAKLTASSIDLAISGAYYHVHYAYDSRTNSYNRYEGGQPHMEIPSASSSKQVQLHPKVVIALVIPLSNGQLDSSGAYYSDYDTSGSGIAYVFQDGGLTRGTWTKEGTTGDLQLTDPGGHALKLDAGQTWLTLVSSTSQISYK